jgi:hypothetical protein
MRRSRVLIGLALATVAAAIPVIAWAHACHDFTRRVVRPPSGAPTVTKPNIIASQDDLIVKIDVQDGKLRIGDEASFRVYLFNTSEATVENLSLDVSTNGAFKAEVKPGADWQGFPKLKPMDKGGRKEFFEVTLKRSPGVADGKYAIGLNLFNSQNRSVYKSLDLERAADIVALAKAPAIKIDGNAEEVEWGKAALCTDFYAYTAVKSGNNQYNQNVPATSAPTRVRLTADADNLYCLMQFSGGRSDSDTAVMYLAASGESADIVQLTFDRAAGKVTCTKGEQGLQFAADGSKEKFECKIPRELVGLKGAKSFRANFVRTMAGKDASGKDQKLVTYWRGNERSLNSPLVYGQFSLPE